MRTIAIANQKGGCGKTTVAINLAATLAREGQRTLLIDLDPQGHCALGLAVPEEQIQHSVLELLLNPTSKFDQVRWQISSNFDLVPSKIDLAQLERRLATDDDRETRLAQVLSPVAERYDIVLVDTPPTVGVLTGNALRAADEVIVPVDTGYFALHGLSKQLDTLKRIARETGHLCRLIILANLYDVRTKLAREILAELRRRHSDSMLAAFINFNTKLKESSSLGQPITEYDPASSGCRDFSRLARELLSLTPGAGAAVERPSPEDLVQRAEDLALKANALLATSRPLFSSPPDRPSESILVDTESNHGAANGVSTPKPPRDPAPAAASTFVDHSAIERRIAEAYGVRTTADGVRFVLKAPGAHHVRLAGDFNGWSPDVTPLRLCGRDDVFMVTLPLGPGRYRYRYVIDGSWHSDPHNPYVETNPFGDLNSIVEVAGVPA